MKKYLKNLWSAKTIGFDIIEISENSIHLTFEEKKKILKIVDSYDMKAQWKIGHKDPRRQLSVDETIKKMNEILEMSQEKIVLEANLGYNEGIYDEKGDIK